MLLDRYLAVHLLPAVKRERAIGQTENAVKWPPKASGSQEQHASQPEGENAQDWPGYDLYASRLRRRSNGGTPRTRAVGSAPKNASSMAALFTVLMWAALSGSSVAQTRWAQHSCKRAFISYQLPSIWQVESEATLEKAGYLSDPYPTYALLAGAEPAKLAGVPDPPSVYAFSETPSPWFMVLVTTGTSAAPAPQDAYELAPEGEVTLQQEQGLDPSVVSLTKPVEVGSWSMHGSQDRSEVIVPGAGDIEMDEVVYAKGGTVWMTMAGCTVACYNANAFTLSTRDRQREGRRCSLMNRLRGCASLKGAKTFVARHTGCGRSILPPKGRHAFETRGGWSSASTKCSTGPNEPCSPHSAAPRRAARATGRAVAWRGTENAIGQTPSFTTNLGARARG